MAPRQLESEQLLEQEGLSPFLFVVPALALLLDVIVVASGASSQTVWYVIRASGIIAYVLLALSVIAGMLISTRSLPPGKGRVDVYEVHNFTALLILGFTSIHGVALLLDNFIGFTPGQIIVPFTSDYRPVAVAAGILTGYVALIVYGSFWTRKMIGYRGWRTLHYATFAAFILGALHGIFSGTDSDTAWMVAIYAASLVIVGLLLSYRILTAQPKRGAAAA